MIAMVSVILCLNDDGTMTLNVPLGEYTLKEVKTKYGYVLPEQPSWELSFKWNNKDDEYVFDISENSKDGNIDIHNDMVKTDITLEKQIQRRTSLLEIQDLDFIQGTTFTTRMEM